MDRRDSDRAAVGASDAAQRSRRVRLLEMVARGRKVNALYRLAGCALSVALTSQLVGEPWPFIWYGGLVLVIAFEWWINARIASSCARGIWPSYYKAVIAWTAFQSAYINGLAAILWGWSSSHVADTLAIIYLLAGLANAVATMRQAPAMAAAGLATGTIYLLGLPLSDFIASGAADFHHLYQVIGVLMFLAFGTNLWVSLRKSDDMQIAAESAIAREKQAVESAAQSKSRTIQRMIDELRTPMAALAGAAENMRRAFNTPEGRGHASAIVEAQDVLAAVLADMRDLDTIENDKLLIEPRPADPRALVRSVVGAFRVTAHDKGIELFLDIAPNTPEVVRLDPVRVRQILFNLISNAVRFTGQGGVRVKLQCQDGAPPGQARLAFIIADTGPGMSRSQLAQVFGQTPGQARGAGLGLSISLRLARLMNAKLGARSELGAGSVFSLILDVPVIGAESANRPAA